jgi:hypothetical protein
MTPEEKILNLIREDLIVRHGEEFLELTEREQTLLICDELEKQFKRIRNGE